MSVKQRKVSKPLTVERLRKFPGLDTVTDDEAVEIIDSLDQLARILHAYFQNIKLHEHEKQHIDPDLCQRQSKQ